MSRIQVGNKRSFLAGAMGVAAAGLIAFVPAIGASVHSLPFKRAPSLGAAASGIGTFTPAAGDPKLAALLARSGSGGSGFRFTPSASVNRAKAIRVAVRATGTMPKPSTAAPDASGSALIGIAPVSYSLGVGVGWKRFAVSGDVARVDSGLAGAREMADLGISYNSDKWSTRVKLAADRPSGNVPRTISGDPSVSVDVGGSYRLTRNLDVTAGVRYKSERYRLDRAQDDRRDSQAVYVGTAFRF